MRGQEALTICLAVRAAPINLPHEGSGVALSPFERPNCASSTFPMRGQELRRMRHLHNRAQINLPHEGSGGNDFTKRKTSSSSSTFPMRGQELLPTIRTALMRLNQPSP